MTDIAIRVENLSKQYRIGGPRARYKTIRESLTEAVGAPFRRLSSVVRGQSSAVSNETLWALKDVSFEACPEPVEGSSAAKWWASLRQASTSDMLRTGLGMKRANVFRGSGASPTGHLPGRGAGSHVQQTARVMLAFEPVQEETGG